MIANLTTDRLQLRDWRDDDYRAFARLNRDPAVMEFFENTLNEEESNHLADKIAASLRRDGYGLWAAELVETGEFIGFIGLSVPRPTLPCYPTIEIGWRLGRRYWGHGLATEGAKASLRHGFEAVGLDEIVSMTSTLNLRSMAVMERIGMVRDASADFEHPAISPGHALRPHVLYRLTAEDWRAQTSAVR